MGDFMDKAKDLAGQHDKQVDEGIEKAGDQFDKRTGDKYTSEVDKAQQYAEQRTGDQAQ